MLEEEDNIDLNWKQILEEIINNAGDVLKAPQQLREFQEFARTYDPLDPSFHNKSQEYFEKAKKMNLIFNIIEKVNLGEKMDAFAKLGPDWKSNSAFNTYIKQINTMGKTNIK